MQGLVHRCGEAPASSSHVTVGKSLGSQAIPQAAKPGLGEMLFLYRAGNVVSPALA